MWPRERNGNKTLTPDWLLPMAMGLAAYLLMAGGLTALRELLGWPGDEVQLPGGGVMWVDYYFGTNYVPLSAYVWVQLSLLLTGVFLVLLRHEHQWLDPSQSLRFLLVTACLVLVAMQVKDSWPTGGELASYEVAAEITVIAAALVLSGANEFLWQRKRSRRG